LSEPNQPDSNEPGQENLYEVPVMVAPFRLDSLLRADEARYALQPTEPDEPDESELTDEELEPRPRARHAAGRDKNAPRELATEWGSVPLFEGPILEPEPEPEPEPTREPTPLRVSSAAILAAAPAVIRVPDEPSPAVVHMARANRPRARRNRSRARPAAILVLVAIVVLAGLVAFRLHSPVPNAVVTADLTSNVTIQSPDVTLPWPTVGEAAVSVPLVGFDMPSAPETPVPIASLTKMMTAYIILHDHPLGLGQKGSTITITQADLDDYNNDTVTDQANAQVNLGERITERNLLGGMLVHSANDYAGALARWDAGSIPAFVAKMNQTAASLGMIHTHYADASGYDQSSQSTAEDLLKVAAPDMANPVFAYFVKMSSINLPIAGTLSTYTPLLGLQGVLGVKSGFTTAAGGCDVLAVKRVVHGKTVLVITAVTGQTGPNVIDEAGLQALNLANATAKDVGETTVVSPDESSARVSAAGTTQTAKAASGTRMLSWPGVVAHRHFVPGKVLHQGAKSGTVVGTIVVQLGRQRQVIPVRLEHDVARESLFSRIL
jgi:D-alanyl-D-alanine carboxypeptidase (penicillin-binding protein 5/6)